MRELRDTAADWIRDGRAAWVVEISAAQGSTPRAAGTRMLVASDAVVGTIGGGRLELEAIRLARERLDATQAPAPAFERRFALGPSLGQCCGGSLTLRFVPLGRAALADWPAAQPRFHLMLYGAGHVGRAIAAVLEAVPCTVDWIDEREGEFALAMVARGGRPWPAHIRIRCADAVEAEVSHAPPGAFHLVLTHSHALDLAICEAVLRRGDFGFLGLIGSRTKRARFARRLGERGIAAHRIARLTSPIGIDGIRGKEPGVIAVATVAQLLRLDGTCTPDAEARTEATAAAGPRD
jgi:xanthine dehydrogenase accessory factor